MRISTGRGECTLVPFVTGRALFAFRRSDILGSSLREVRPDLTVSMGGDSEPPRRGASRSSENPPPRCDVSSDELDPTLEATARLFAGDLEKFFLRYVTPEARRFSADADEASEKIEGLYESEEVREDEINRLARLKERKEFEGLEFLLDKVRRAASFLSIPRFSRFADALEHELTRTKVASEVVERLFPLIAQVFELFRAPERAQTWTAEFELWLVRELQRIPDGKIARTASSERPTADQRTQQIGDRVVSHLPPRSGTTAQQTAQGGSQIDIATVLTTSWKRFIAGIMLDHPEYSSKQICVAADRRRNSTKEGETRKELAPPAPWMRASGETRPRDQYLLDDALWARVYNEAGSRRGLEVEFSKIRTKLGLKNRRAV